MSTEVQAMATVHIYKKLKIINSLKYREMKLLQTLVRYEKLLCVEKQCSCMHRYVKRDCFKIT